MNLAAQAFVTVTCGLVERKITGFENKSNISEGVVKDIGNDLMNNATKCLAAIDKVFGTNKIADPDGIITAIRVNVLIYVCSGKTTFFASMVRRPKSHIVKFKLHIAV
jgi:hypothetical protein